MIEIDGSYGEGGGAIVRNALSLAAVFGKSVHIYSIRHGRPKPGLQAQHLTGVKAVAKLCDAKISEAKIGTTDVFFEPNEIRGGEYEFDIGTAGSVTLVMQSLLPMLAFAKSKTTIKLRGGTHVEWSPSFYYLQNVLLPCLARMGYECDATLTKYGWYPKGGGEITVSAKPAKLKNIDFSERGKLLLVKGVSCTSNLPPHIAERQRKSAATILLKNGFNAEIRVDGGKALSPGTCMDLWAHFENGYLGASSLGKIGKSAEKVGEEAANELLNEIKSNASVDKHLADQLILFMGLAVGKSTIITSEISDHTKTSIWLLKQFLPTIDVKIDRNRIEVNGSGWHL